MRMEDLDRVTSSIAHERSQLADLAAIGLDWDGPVVRQSERFERYRDAIGRLAAKGLVYPCYCTRREIRAEIDAAASAPHDLVPDGAYPGTCRELTGRQRAVFEAGGRRPALRLRTDGRSITFVDQLHGEVTGAVDDVVLARRDGVPAYNLAVVVDDAAQGVTQVVRGDDLLLSTPRQILLQQLLELPRPGHLHVPLVLGADGVRLAKRHGAVTITDLAERGVSPGEVRSALAASLGLARRDEVVSPEGLIQGFDVAHLARGPVRIGDLFDHVE